MSRDNRSAIALTLAGVEVKKAGDSVDKVPEIAKKYKDALGSNGLNCDNLDPIVMSKLLEVLAEI